MPQEDGLFAMPSTRAIARAVLVAIPVLVAFGLLAIAPPTACLVLERRTWRGADRITDVRLTFPGDAYDLVATFTPSKD